MISRNAPSQISGILGNPPPAPLTEELSVGFPTSEQQEQAGRRRERSRAERETADLMMNYMITCYASELFIQVEAHLQSRQRRRPSPLPSSSSLLRPSSSLTPNTATTITRTDVCCNPVAPFAVDTWRRHLDRNAAPLQIGVCVRVCVYACVNVNQRKSLNLVVRVRIMCMCACVCVCASACHL